MYDASVAIDFSPLSKIGDHFVKQREDARDRALMATVMGTDVASAGPQIAAPGPAASTSPRPPAFAGGNTRMAMPPEAFAPLIKQAAAEHGLDEGMFTRQLAQESSFNPNAVSRAGAVGVAQFMPGTAQRFGINPRDPAQAIPAAARYVAENRKLLGNDGLALAGYNWGESNVQRWLSSGADPSRVPAETRDYVQKITGRPIEAWASTRGGQTAPMQAPAPQGGATAAPAVQVAQMQGAPGAQPGAAPAAAAAPAQNPAKRAALVQLLNSGNPAMRETARFLLTDMKKDDNWQLTEHAGQKFFYNTRTKQIVESGLPAERTTNIVRPDGTILNQDAKGAVTTGYKAEGAPTKVQELEAFNKNPALLDTELKLRGASKAETSINTQVNPVFKALGDDFDTQLKAARSAPGRIEAAYETRRAIENGAITGLFSDGRMNLAKAAELFGLGDGAAASTETLRAALGNKVLENIKLLTPASNNDVRYLERIKGGTEKLEAKTLLRLAEMEERAARKAIQLFNNTGARLRSEHGKVFQGYEGMLKHDEPGSYEDYVRANPVERTEAADQSNATRGLTHILPEGGISGTIPGTNIPYTLKPSAPKRAQ